VVSAKAADLGRDGAALLIAGDFNLPPESAIFRASWGGYTDAFPAAGCGYGYTKFTRWWGARIDHVLAGAGWQVRDCTVGPDVGSDHRPVLATLEWVGGAAQN
jgi:endonuclease/exonuclease/phosphatase (EEP) superfamily protein YafD